MTLVRRLGAAALLFALAGTAAGANPAAPEAARPRVDGPRTIGREEVRRDAERREHALRKRREARRARRGDYRASENLLGALGDPRLGTLPDAPGGELATMKEGGAQ